MNKQLKRPQDGEAAVLLGLTTILDVVPCSALANRCVGDRLAENIEVPRITPQLQRSTSVWNEFLASAVYFSRHKSPKN